VSCIRPSSGLDLTSRPSTWKTATEASLWHAKVSGLSGAARELGARHLVLETGVYQQAAISLYRSAGFKQIDCCGEYAASPTSVCFEKIL